ncbi:MAG: PAS domain-containing protein [Pseudomonadota bacterium]
MADTRDPIARLKDKIERSGWGTSVDETMSFVQPELVSIYGLWRARADLAGALPRREDLDLRSLKPYLEHLSVVERVEVAPGKSGYRLRLQGSFLGEMFGHHTGKLLDEVAPPELAERWTYIYDALLEMKRPLRLQGTYRQEAMEHLIAESLAVPLGNGDAPPVSVLAATYYRSRYKDEA